MPNESAKIILAVTNGKLSKVRDALAVEGTINALKCGFQFRTQDWDGTTKTAVFVRGRATPSTTNADITYVILDENNECDVPAEILEKDGMFSVGVFGESENYRIVSNWMCYKIADGCYADGSTPVDPGSSAYNQLIKMIKSKSDIGHNHAELYYTKDESEDRFVSQEELSGMTTTPDWNQNDETANDYIKNKPTIPTTLAELSDDDAHRTVTDIEKSEWNEKATKEEMQTIKPKSTSITLLTANWTGSNNLFSQEVTIDGITANSKIDLQPTPEQFLELQEGNITLMVSNNNGTATAYAMNFKPTNDYEMQVLITEVTSI